MNVSQWLPIHPKDFEPVLRFVNEKPQENWKERLAEAMGKERMLDVQVVKDGKIHKIKTEPSELPMERNQQEEWIVAMRGKCCGGELLAWEPALPKIFGEEPTLPHVIKLWTVLKEILDMIVIARYFWI